MYVDLQSQQGWKIKKKIFVFLFVRETFSEKTTRISFSFWGLIMLVYINTLTSFDGLKKIMNMFSHKKSKGCGVSVVLQHTIQ